MAPMPTIPAVCAYCGAALMLAAAVLGGSPTTAVLAAGVMLALGAAFALTVPLGARLRRERLEFAWRLVRPEGSAAGVIAGAPFELRCQLHNRSARALSFVELTPVLPAGVKLLSGALDALGLPAHSSCEFGLRLSAAAAGRVVPQGFAVAVAGPCGLFLAPLYFPSPLPIRVLPRSAARGSAPLLLPASDPRAGARAVRQRGAGSELHELREHRAGDPFNTIAWKASARTGKLLVREGEREMQDDLQLVLDVSGTMRGGVPGERKLDHAIELCAWLAHRALERGDRVGLLTVDGRIITRVNAAEGLPQMLRVYEALLQATELVDADLTENDDDYVTALVGLYLRQQLGVELVRAGRWDLPAIVARVASLLDDDGELHDVPVVASTPAHAQLRRFCRARGIALPYRSSTRNAAKQSGLAAAMRTAAGLGQAPRTVLVVSDFDGLGELRSLLQSARLLKQRRHALALVYAEAEGAEAQPQNQLERDLRHVYGTEERARRAQLAAALSRLGVPLLSLARGATPSELLRSIASLRRAA